jgi:hypothetical protein
MVENLILGKIYYGYVQDLFKLDMKTKEYKKLETGGTSHNMLTCTGSGELYCEVGSPTKFPCIVRMNTQTGEVGLIIGVLI